ncbi:MAG: YifB family Mg chelatase-like AAA ATPase [Candidatus Pacebacteria bacterium]|nr:YifB family Mg chelatase-like AAA ATPase [Candidatus Paceibacterota bacterium]MDD5356810.1 YifB family Mg chelatase-like AAA ATPase [Candidatus Paceibacterota bacterium]
MSFAKVYSAQTTLLDAQIITIEVDLSKGLHSFSIVGLPDKGIEESRDRVGAAIKNSGFKSPKNKNQKVVVSLAPADVKKEGPLFDLPIALAYLLASGDISFNPGKKIFLGELSLDGELRSVKGILPLTQKAKQKGFEEIYVPIENAREAALIEGIRIFGAKSLKEIIGHVQEGKSKDREDSVIEIRKIPETSKTELLHKIPKDFNDFADIKGQEGAKRGLEIAAAGRHNIAMWGPPGTGKTMLAEALIHILPPLSFEEALETTAIHSVAGALRGDLVTNPPFRSPHHTSSYVSLIGGGVTPKPGEATLAHRGVLFLDEFPEFDRRVINSLRQPLEEREISISRAKGSATFPANFILIAAMNPCPCGNWGVKGKECVCSPITISRYQRKIGGPVMDRIDMWVEVSKVDYGKLGSEREEKSETESVKKRVERAREIQKRRFEKIGRAGSTNSEIKARDLAKIIVLEQKVKELLNASAQKLDLSARGYHRVLKLSRTIADLDESESVKEKHILEALQYRPKKLI